MAVALLAPTCPLRDATHIDGTLDLWRRSGLDSAVTVYPFERNPFAVFTREADGRLREVFQEVAMPLRRQDLPAYVMHSQAVIVSTSTYLESVDDSAPVIHWGSVVGFPVGLADAFDIDNRVDLLVADALLRARMTRVTRWVAAGAD